MPAFGLPQLSCDPVLFLPLWLGTLRDHSGFGNHAVVATAPYWTNAAGRDSLCAAGASRLTVTNTAILETVTDNTFFAFGRFDNNPARRHIFSKWDVGGAQIDIRLIGSTVEVYDNAANRTRDTGNLAAVQSICTRLQNWDVVYLYTNGTLYGALSGINTFAANDADISLLNIYTGVSPCTNPISGILWYDVLLTPDEILSLHTWSQQRFTPRKQWPGSGLRYPDRETNLLVDGDMEAVGTAAWFASGGGVLSKQTDNPHSGSQVLRVGGALGGRASQLNTTVVGNQYNPRGYARGDGIAVPALCYAAGGAFWTGTNSTDWQFYDEIVTADSAHGFLYRWVAGAGDHVDFDDIKVWDRPPGYTHRTGDPLFLDNIQTARVTLANITSGRVSNTPHTVRSGTWALNEDADTGERYIECVVAGIIARRNLFARGTPEFDVEKGGGTNSLNLLFSVVAPTDWADSAQNGYMYQFGSTERAVLRRITAGVSTPIAMSDAAYVVNNQRYKIRISVSAAGVFTAYIMGGTFANWTLVSAAGGGSNPVTDNTHTTSVYAVFDFDAGDRLYLDRQFAGVLAPV